MPRSKHTRKGKKRNPPSPEGLGLENKHSGRFKQYYDPGKRPMPPNPLKKTYVTKRGRRGG